MTDTEHNEREKSKIINKFRVLSDMYHNLSLVMYELSQSLTIEARHSTLKEFKAHLKSLNLDVEKIRHLSQSLKNISLTELKGGKKEK